VPFLENIAPEIALYRSIRQRDIFFESSAVHSISAGAVKTEPWSKSKWLPFLSRSPEHHFSGFVERAPSSAAPPGDTPLRSRCPPRVPSSGGNDLGPLNCARHARVSDLTTPDVDARARIIRDHCSAIAKASFSRFRHLSPPSASIFHHCSKSLRKVRRIACPGEDLATKCRKSHTRYGSGPDARDR